MRLAFKKRELGWYGVAERLSQPLLCQQASRCFSIGGVNTGGYDSRRFGTLDVLTVGPNRTSYLLRFGAKSSPAAFTSQDRKQRTE
jgi:hypothetical protein